MNFIHHSSKFPVCTTSGLQTAFCPRALSCLRHRAFLGPEIWPLGACALLLSSPARRAHGTHLSSVHLAAVQHMPGNAHPMCGFVAIATPRFASRATGAMSCHGCPMHAGNRPHRHTLQCSPSQHWMPDAVARATTSSQSTFALIAAGRVLWHRGQARMRQTCQIVKAEASSWRVGGGCACFATWLRAWDWKTWRAACLAVLAAMATTLHHSRLRCCRYRHNHLHHRFPSPRLRHMHSPCQKFTISNNARITSCSCGSPRHVRSAVSRVVTSPQGLLRPTATSNRQSRTAGSKMRGNTLSFSLLL